MTPRTVIRGDHRHGVNRYARTVAAHLPETDGARAHVHFTDRLWGASPEDAAARFERFAAEVPTTVTLHDAPQPSDGERNLPRRSEAYRRVVGAARGVACSSTHEARLLSRHVRTRAHVIPHYVEAPDGVRPDEVDGSVGILGFIYPGKGHPEVLDAAEGLAPVVFLGGAAPGHEADADALRPRAAEITGYLEDAALAARLRTVGVPVAAHRHLSASGSIATWIAAGRRPLVPDGPYARELAPGTVTLYTDLRAAIATALADPASTWRAPDVDPGPSPRATAEAYRAWWEQVAW